MKLVLGVLTLVFALAGVACFGYSEGEMQLELDEQAAASDLKHIQELAEVEAVANAISESLHGQIDAANREVTTALVEVAILEDRIITSRRNEAALQAEVDGWVVEFASLETQLSEANSRFVLDTERYKTKLYGLVEELDDAYELLQASGTETRWSWLPLKSVHSSAPVVYAISALPSDIHALMLHCYEGKTWLWLWPYGYDLHGGENYHVFAGFDDAPLVGQVTEPYNPGPAVGLLDVEGGTLWHKDTFSVQGAYGGFTVFDTTQLKRMFPTEGALCSGDPPNGY